jgi:hypothetical protein
MSEDKKETTASHHLAVLRLDNGELTEDVIGAEALEEPAGAGTAGSPGHRLVDSHPLPEATDGSDPADPRPGTLPRESGGD